MHQYYVYMLQSLKDKDFYIGYTSLSPHERLKKHNKGHVLSTKTRRPWIIIYFEQYSNKLLAYKREYYLKHPPGYKEKLFIINKYSNISQIHAITI